MVANDESRLNIPTVVFVDKIQLLLPEECFEVATLSLGRTSKSLPVSHLLVWKEDLAAS